MKFEIFWFLSLAFLILKLVNIISWPWVFVFAPIWAGFVIWITFTVAMIFINTR